MDKNERVRNYSKNVKEIYAPGSKQTTRSSRQNNGLSDYEAYGANAEERKSFLVDTETGNSKQIKTRLRSGYTENRITTSDTNTQDIAE